MKVYNRKSLRLKGYDYSRAGKYFITTCTYKRQNLFGKIKNKKMILNHAGKIIKRWYLELENKYNTTCHEYIIMPDHVHFIIEINADMSLCTHIKLGQIVGWFKTFTTNEIIKEVKSKKLKPFYKKVWQRDYYESIIRTERGFERVVKYIKNNPLKYIDAKENKK